MTLESVERERHASEDPEPLGGKLHPVLARGELLVPVGAKRQVAHAKVAAVSAGAGPLASCLLLRTA